MFRYFTLKKKRHYFGSLKYKNPCFCLKFHGRAELIFTIYLLSKNLRANSAICKGVGRHRQGGHVPLAANFLTIETTKIGVEPSPL